MTARGRVWGGRGGDLWTVDHTVAEVKGAAARPVDGETLANKVLSTRLDSAAAATLDAAAHLTPMLLRRCFVSQLGRTRRVCRLDPPRIKS